MEVQEDRTERQKEGIRKWVSNGCFGVWAWSTGVGKTHGASMAIKLLKRKFPNLSVQVIVPTTNLKKQWADKLKQECLSENCTVKVINSAIKKDSECDLLILDECHLYLAKQTKQIFTKCKYRFLLGLSATMERLDGEHEWMLQFCPIVDTISKEEAIRNGWLSTYVEYKVVLNVPDINVYKEYNKAFNIAFEYFNYDFNVAMNIMRDQKMKFDLCNKLKAFNPKRTTSDIMKEIMAYGAMFNRALQNRKRFINNHPAKIDIAREIIRHRANSKIITFSATTEMAKKIGFGEVYVGNKSKKAGDSILQKFITAPKGVIHSCAKLNTGFDCPGLNTAIIIGQNSSNTTLTQRIGRAIRKEPDKHAEIFTVVINDTVETKWFDKSHKDSTVIPIDEENLLKMLKGEPWEMCYDPIKNLISRY